MAPKVPTVRLNSGYDMPILGLGTYQGTGKPGEVGEVVKTAIDVGYRQIDGAMIYRNEPELGAAIKEKIAEGVVKREDLFLTSKLWNTFHSPDLVVPTLKKTLADLEIEYLDLYLVHWPMGFKEADESNSKDGVAGFVHSDVDYVDTWKAMEECVKLGLTKSIGVSNFNSEQLARVLQVATIPPATNQIEVHPYLNQAKLVALCQEKGIAITGYSPLGAPDRPWAKPDDPKLLEDANLIELGKKYNKSAAQVVLRWVVQRGIIVIPKSASKNRLIENMNIFDFTLSDEDMAYLTTFERNGRTCPFSTDLHHKHYPFHIEF